MVAWVQADSFEADPPQSERVRGGYLAGFWPSETIRKQVIGLAAREAYSGCESCEPVVSGRKRPPVVCFNAVGHTTLL
jgi:hypothetical protein